MADSTSCPKLLEADTFSGNYLLHTGYRYEVNPLVIAAEGLDTLSEQFVAGEFQCVVRSEGVELFRADADLVGSTAVECQILQVSWRQTVAGTIMC